MNRHHLPVLLGIVLGLGACGEYLLAAAPSGRGHGQESASGEAAGSKGEAAAKGGNVRPPAWAGNYYPAERSLVVAETRRMMRSVSAGPSLPAKPIAVVVPHARWSQSGDAMVAAFRAIGPDDFKRVVLVGPSHDDKFEGIAIPDVKAYRTPMGDVPLCPEAAKLADDDPARKDAKADRQEQSLELELPVLQVRLRSFCLVPIVVGKVDTSSERKLAERLSRLRDGKTLFVFSSDLIHYGPRYTYTPLGMSAAKVRDQIVALEKRAISYLQNRDATGFRKFVDSTGATICGYHALSVLLELLGKIAPSAESVLFAYYGSSDVGDTKDENRVGWASLGYLENEPAPNPPIKPLGAPVKPKLPAGDASSLSSEQGNVLLRVARATLNTELKHTRDLDTELEAVPVTGALDRVQAAYVTLTKGTEVRGGMGQTQAEFRLPEAVIRATLDAALHDPRFKPIKPDEIDQLTVEVALISRPRAVNSYKDIALGTDGIIFEKDNKSALLLPREPIEQNWSMVRALTVLAKKAGLTSRDWRAADARFSVFTAQAFRQDAVAAPPPPPAAAAAQSEEASSEIVRDPYRDEPKPRDETPSEIVRDPNQAFRDKPKPKSAPKRPAEGSSEIIRDPF